MILNSQRAEEKKNARVWGIIVKLAKHAVKYYEVFNEA
jgi:hypothetical protein